MLSDIISAGQILEMQEVKRNAPETEGEQEEKKVHRTKVFDVLSEDQLEVMMPIEKGLMVLLPVDGEFELWFYTENGLYQCYARVLDRYKSNNVYIAVMELTSNLRKHQRREYYRFSCALEMNSREMDAEEIKALQEKQLYFKSGLPVKQSTIVDISGGGLRFISTFNYNTDALLYCNFVLRTKGGMKEYQMGGKVLAVREVEGKPGSYEHRVQYLNMDVDEREEIIKYIFEQERKQRHKERSI